MLLSKIKVAGRSMEPTLKNGQIVIASSIPFFFKKPKPGDIIILLHRQCIIKRITKVKDGEVFVVGDNKKESTDSRNFGWVSKKEILGRVIGKI